MDSIACSGQYGFNSTLNTHQAHPEQSQLNASWIDGGMLTVDCVACFCVHYFQHSGNFLGKETSEQREYNVRALCT